MSADDKARAVIQHLRDGGFITKYRDIPNINFDAIVRIIGGEP